VPKAWSPSLQKSIETDVYLNADDAAGLAKYQGTLKGKIVLISPPREIALVSSHWARVIPEDRCQR
jgi:hypothetical protein